MGLLVKEVIEQLQKCDPDTPVRIYADHGQVSQMVSEVGTMYTTEPEEYSVEEAFDCTREYTEEHGGVTSDLSAFVEIW